eukprot:COSAG02_NODE_685_length_18484_cov_49.605330_4_plen_361_part_00
MGALRYVQGRITGAELCAAVSEAGGIGTLGMIGLSPEGMRDQIKKVKQLTQKPYGVDLLLPQVGGNARKTNKDYTGGQLEELVEIMVEERVPLFVCAVGVPPLWVVEKLHAAGTLVMNMVGQPKHATKALALGVDIICAQGTEAGGHTGDISTLVLLPQVIDMCARKALVVAAGGIFDGRGIAACMAMGAAGVWVGTAFLATPEANVEDVYKQRLLESDSSQTIRSEIYTGRPARSIQTPYNLGWAKREAEMRELLQKGIIPQVHDARQRRKEGKGRSMSTKLREERRKVPGGFLEDRRTLASNNHFDLDSDFIIAGQAVGGMHDIIPAGDLVRRMMSELVAALGAVPAVVVKEVQQARL